MILDDGGDATLLLHLGTQAESDPAILRYPEAPKRLFYSRRSSNAWRCNRTGIWRA